MTTSGVCLLIAKRSESCEQIFDKRFLEQKNYTIPQSSGVELFSWRGPTAPEHILPYCEYTKRTVRKLLQHSQPKSAKDVSCSRRTQVHRIRCFVGEDAGVRVPLVGYLSLLERRARTPRVLDSIAGVRGFRLRGGFYIVGCATWSVVSD